MKSYKNVLIEDAIYKKFIQRHLFPVDNQKKKVNWWFEWAMVDNQSKCKRLDLKVNYICGNQYRDF